MSEQELVNEELRRLAVSGDIGRFLVHARKLHPSDLSDILAGLEPDVRLKLVKTLPPEVVSEALAEMEEEEHPEELLAALRPEQAADIVEELEDDDAVDLIAELPPETAARILSSVADRADIERLLTYDEESAGGRMTAAVVAVSQQVTAGQAIEEVRRQAEQVGEFYQVYCVDDRDRLVGILPLQRMVVAKPETPVREIMEPPPAVASPELDQEEVARLMARYNVPAIPVVDHGGKLLGRITFDDVIDVVEAERTEDLLKFGGAAGDEHLAGEWHHAVRRRLPWLYLNLLTAFFAAAVVLVFEETISQIVVLAALMPIVAGLGGSAGTQALAVTVRRIALGMIPTHSGFALVGKEMLVGIINGLAIGLVVGLVTVATGRGWQLGAVVMLAMWGSLMVAATVGAAVPLVLQKLGVDPAVASSGFVSAVTDIAGFFLLLGLAAMLLLPGG
ncbi:MAG: magnesium transporter [Gemmatimonadales bacterium]|nr:magnesium transporter [Gemmatimonadales bacterium]NIN12466.1 magnesium transporter [Gemmatimonadales bacterium]NIN50842.1 magnesium transporter [Gemmatimonadales bacterium]NIP08306.1 magnesium transporter [Gemmatimonadales bacterium]NIR00830.1 magnesium transporter [Gemmatimonadales bacterium]